MPPYDRIGDAHKSILAIKPRVSLWQANYIAGLHEALADETENGAWPMAITRFKQLYTVRDGKWTPREKKTQAVEDDDMPQKMIEVDGNLVTLDALIEVWRTFQEQKMKTVGGEKFPASDFLVVEDPESPSKWHLQVKAHGKPDRRLMGAAKAALTSPGGFRGNKYEGPNKAEAIRKLKALYKAEGLDFGESEENGQEIASSRTLLAMTDAMENGDMGEPMMVVQGPTTFADLIARKQAREAADEVYELTYQFQMLANNVMASPDVADKLAALKSLVAEYILLIEAQLAMVGTPETAEARDAEAQPHQPAQDELTESESGQAVSLVEVADGPPAVVDVEIIQPGWGNTRDNHYYPAEVLKRDAGVFKGAKMYATDHKPEQKSVLTEVSTIMDIVGMSEKGAPIARVGIHNPEFAADVRNRAKLGVLSELHCSILARGTARDYAEGDRKGMLVESITAVQSVDWVTRAGAGGHAVALVESEPGAQADKATPEPSAEGGDPHGVQEQGQGQRQEGQGQEKVAEAQPVTISEAAQTQSAAGANEFAATGAATAQSAAGANEFAATNAETWLSEADVAAELGKRPALHPEIRARVASVRYHGLAELAAALEREIDYYKRITGSGSPFESPARRGEQPLTEAEREKLRKANFNRVMREIGMQEVN